MEFLVRNIHLIFFYSVLAITATAAWLQILYPARLKRWASRIFLYSCGWVFAYLIFISFLQFQVFQSGFLAPVLATQSGLVWFLGYVRAHFWNDYLVSLPIAILFALVGYFFNKKYHERFFEKEELYLIALGILLVGYPGFLLYLLLVLLAPAIVSALFVKKGERLPLYHFWMPTAILVILIVHFWLAPLSWWTTFKF